MTRLVLDADVIRGANPDVDDDVCLLCAECLDGVSSGRFVIVLSEQGEAEVRSPEARTGFGLEWFVIMTQSGRVEVLSTRRDNSFADEVVAAVSTNLSPDEIRKDVHLVDCALSTDKRVVSRDRSARAAFASASDTCAELATIVWVNPGQPSERCATWLRQGAPLVQARMLGKLLQRSVG